jgi:hypothetical protein
MDTDASILSDNLVDAFRKLAQIFDRFQVKYALIGGAAISYYARPRATRDLDFLLLVPQVTLPKMLEELQAQGFEFDAIAVIREWVQEHMTAIFYQGAKIDLLKPVVAAYQHVLDRATAVPFFGVNVRVASPDGLILMKLLAFRRVDQVDIENLLAANRGKLDLEYIEREWATVGEPDDPRMLDFRQMVERFYTPPPS